MTATERLDKMNRILTAFISHYNEVLRSDDADDTDLAAIEVARRSLKWVHLVMNESSTINYWIDRIEKGRFEK